MKNIIENEQGNQLDKIRTETVLSRFPIHNLTQRDNININITKHDDNGKVNLLWKVSPNPEYGSPRQLAYKLDSLVINRCLDELGRPLPEVIKVGKSLRGISRELGGREAEIKRAFLQNAGVLLNAKLTYRDRDKTERYIDATFTRYGVVFTGKKLPDGRKADGVYIILNNPYREVLNHAPVRPLDYDYLKQLPPVAQRFYEDLSYKVFAAIKYKRATAKLIYSEFCTFAPQRRYHSREQVQKQMCKVHRPHLQSGYIAKVKWEKYTDADGKADWVIYYTLGAKARAEYKAFNIRESKKLETPSLPEVTPEPEFTDLAQALYKCGVRPKSKAIEQAERCPDERIREWIELYDAEVVGSAGLSNALDNDWIPTDKQIEQIEIRRREKQREKLEIQARAIQAKRIHEALKNFLTKDEWAEQEVESRKYTHSFMIKHGKEPLTEQQLDEIRQEAIAKYPETESDRHTYIEKNKYKFNADLEEIEKELQAKDQKHSSTD